MGASLLSVAQALIASGLSVIPIGSLTTKAPDARVLPRGPDGEPVWGEFQSRVATLSELSGFFGPSAALAVVGGMVSGGLTIIDIDTKYGGSRLYDDYVTLVDAMAPDLLARIPLIHTPSGGWHLYLRSSMCGGSEKLARGLDKKTWIETKAQGGYCLAPLSAGYRTERGSLTKIPTLSADEWELLLNCARALNAYVEPVGKHYRTDEKPGNVFNAKISLDEMERWLERAGWRLVHTKHDGTRLLRRPGKSVGVSASLGQGGLRSFFVFSTSAAPFEPNQGYSAFGVYTQLEHGGDYAAAARQLRRDGIGGTPPLPAQGVDGVEGVTGRNGHAKGVEAAEGVEGVQGVEKNEKSDPWFVGIAAPPLLRLDPKHLLAPSLVRYVDTAARIMDMPPEFFIGPLLAVLSVAIGATARIRITDTYQESGMIWDCVVGEAGSGKTPSADKITDAIHLLQRQHYTGWKVAMEEHETALAAWQEDERGSRGPKPTAPHFKRMLISDVTIEALVPIMERTPRGLLLEKDELAGWIKSFNQYKKNGGADREHWLSIWSLKSFLVDRKQESFTAYVTDPYVAVTGGIQPAKLAPMMADIEDGFSDRVIFFWPPTKALELKDIALPEPIVAAYRTLLSALLSLDFATDAEGKPAPFLIRLDGTAYDYFKARQDAMQVRAHDIDTPNRLRTAYAKVPAQAARVALLLHIAQREDGIAVDAQIVNERTMRAAWAIIDVAANHLERIHYELSARAGDTRASLAVAWIRKHGGSVTVRDLVRGRICGIATSSEAQRLMEDLADRHLGLLTQTKAGGWDQARIVLPAEEGQNQKSSTPCTPSTPSAASTPSENGQISTPSTPSIDAVGALPTPSTPLEGSRGASNRSTPSTPSITDNDPMADDGWRF